MTPEEKIKAIFADPETAARAVDILVHEKPQGWSRRSSAPYYSEVFARQIQRDIDQMLESRNDLIYRYDKFASMSENTLYLRLNQSMRFLIEKLDTPDKKYGRWRQMVNVTRVRGIGIRISFLSEFRNADVSDFKAEVVQPQERAPVWKEQMDKWLESSQPGDAPLIIDNLCLTPEEIRTVKESLVGLAGVLHSVTSSTIKLIKVNPVKE